MSVSPERAETTCTRRRDENKPTQLAYDTNSNCALIGELGLTCDGGLLQKGSIRLHQPPFGARSSVTERTSSPSLQVALYGKWRTLILCAGNKTGSGRAFSGFGIWPIYGAGIGNTISILTGSGIWLFPGKRDSPKLGDRTRDLWLHVCRECPKPSCPTGSSGQSESTSRALSGVSFQTKHPMECLVNRS